MDKYTTEIGTLEARLRLNPDDATAKRRLGEVHAQIKAETAEAPEIEVVAPEMEVERAELPKAERTSRGRGKPS